jgi:hypothetical protein
MDLPDRLLPAKTEKSHMLNAVMAMTYARDKIVDAANYFSVKKAANQIKAPPDPEDQVNDAEKVLSQWIRIFLKPDDSVEAQNKLFTFAESFVMHHINDEFVDSVGGGHAETRKDAAELLARIKKRVLNESARKLPQESTPPEQPPLGTWIKTQTDPSGSGADFIRSGNFALVGAGMDESRREARTWWIGITVMMWYLVAMNACAVIAASGGCAEGEAADQPAWYDFLPVAGNILGSGLRFVGWRTAAAVVDHAGDWGAHQQRLSAAGTCNGVIYQTADQIQWNGLHGEVLRGVANLVFTFGAQRLVRWIYGGEGEQDPRRRDQPDPFADATIDGGDHCAVCSRVALGRCKACKAPYCSNVCQKTDWMEGHDKVCQ